MAMPPEIDHAVVAALFQFRMATAEQLRVLHTPDSQPELMRRRLRQLKAEGLVEDVVLPQAGRLRAWFLTERGARIAARFPELRGVASPPLPEDKTEARSVGQ
ncbi:replication-relaxation family protein [Kitasatospora sp. NPDC001159]